MSRGIVKTPAAYHDLVEQAHFIALDSLESAERFLDAVESTFELLAKMSELGTICHFRSKEVAGLRIWPIRGFGNHIVFYRVFENEIEVVRVIHGSRDVENLF